MKKLIDVGLQDAEVQSFKDQLIYKRNVDMAQQLESYLTTEKKYFVVVGAGHLVGDGSILALLRAKRYQIDQLVVRQRAN